MGASALGSRAIIGEFFTRLEQDPGMVLIDGISNLFNSDQESETYKWLGQIPQMREWIGGRQAKGLSASTYTIVNKEYEATLEILVKDLRRDKTGQIMARVRELAERTNAHWAKLLFALIIAGESTVCYDGQFFFDTDHSEGDSGTQDNDITNNISTTTAPTAAEMESSILLAVQQIIGFKDNEGEPMNENAKAFHVVVPVPYLSAAAAALNSQIIIDGGGPRTNTIISAKGSLGGMTFDLTASPRLTWTTKLAVFRTDCETKGLIRQEEVPVQIAAIAEGSELEFKEKKHEYGVSATRNVGYGMWQRACLVTHT
jgi:phage major head subunit gpT-like protein